MNEIGNSQFLYHAWLASALIQQPKLLTDLLNTYGSPEDVFRAFHNDTDSFSAIPKSILSGLRNFAQMKQLKKLNQLLIDKDIQSFTIQDHCYPEVLLHMDEPPAILFYQGHLECLNQRMLAMVGSRACTVDGWNAAERIARALSDKGVTIVSGLAQGIDAASLTGCLAGKQPAVAVMGCGLDCVYPASNARLREQILAQGGLLLSEFAPGEKPINWHFPYRNRIITGLASALIVVEAKIRSGSMTSVHHALNQGKDIFVYPGDPLSALYEGNHQLLREGATFFTKAKDILEDLGWLDNPDKVGHNIGCSGGDEPPPTPEERKIILALAAGKLSFEQLSAECSMAPSVLLSTLTLLQIHGRIEALPGKMYRLRPSEA